MVSLQAFQMACPGFPLGDPGRHLLDALWEDTVWNRAEGPITVNSPSLQGLFAKERVLILLGLPWPPPPADGSVFPCWGAIGMGRQETGGESFHSLEKATATKLRFS